MTFEEWAADQEFWKTDTAEAFRSIWIILSMRFRGDEIASELNCVVAAMRSEYGE